MINFLNPGKEYVFFLHPSPPLGYQMISPYEEMVAYAFSL